MSEPMTCVVDKGTCPCSLVTATGGTCGVFDPPPTFAEAFPYLTDPQAEGGAG